MGHAKVVARRDVQGGHIGDAVDESIMGFIKCDIQHILSWGQIGKLETAYYQAFTFHVFDRGSAHIRGHGEEPLASPVLKGAARRWDW